MSACWLCRSTEAREFLPGTFAGEVTSEDLRISDSHYGRTARIVECRRCGFRYADPVPAPDLVRLYEGLIDPEYHEGREGRIRPFRRIVRRCLRLAPGSRTLLDVGAGTGLLCLAARERGLDATGVEPAAWLVDMARKDHGIPLLLGTFPHPMLVGRQFDLISLIDVIEHVADPRGLLEQISSTLRPGGVAVITTPDANSLACRLFGRRWWHYRLAHVCFFNRRTMSRALAGAGLELVRVEYYYWRFSLEYLAVRMERYLPVGALRRTVARTRLGRALLRRTVPVNLFDSRTYYARKPMGEDR